jgi:hypothetical protein
MNLGDLKVQLGANWKKVGLIALAVLALLAGVWWAWVRHEPPEVVIHSPATQQAQEAATTATTAVSEAETAVKKGKAILKRIPGEVKKIEENSISAAHRASLDELADRANGRIREWVREHPTGNADLSGAGGAVHGAPVPGGGSPTQ